MTHILHLAALAGLAWQSPATPTAKLPVTKIPLKYARPSVVKMQILYPPGLDWWSSDGASESHRTSAAMNPYPDGIQSLTAYDIDSSLIVRGTPDGVRRLNEQIAKVDVEAAMLELAVLVHPIPRDSTNLENVGQARNRGKALFDVPANRRLVIRELWPECVFIAPNAFGEIPIVWPSVVTPVDTSLYLEFHKRTSSRVDILALFSYRDSQYEGQTVAKRLLNIPLRKRTTIVLPVDDKGHPIERYIVDLNPESVRLLNATRPLKVAPRLVDWQ